MAQPVEENPFLAVVRTRLGITDPSWPSIPPALQRIVEERRAAAASATAAEAGRGDTSARYVLEPQLEALGGTLSDRAPASLGSSQATAADDTTAAASPAPAVDYFAVRARIAALLAAKAIR